MATRLLDTVDGPDGFIFSKLTSAPWYSSDTAADLDMDYLYNHSGGKVVSPLVRALLDDGELTDTAITSLARIVWTKYAAKWTGMWEAVTAFQTDPFHEDSYTDTVDSDKTVTYNGSETNSVQYPVASPRTTTRSVTGGWTDTDSTSVVTTGKEKTTEKGDTLSSTFGFDSSSPVGSSKVGPADANGLVTELSYGTGVEGDPGLKRQNGGNIIRQYGANGTPYSESVVESGTVDTTKSFTSRSDVTSRDDTISHVGTKRPVGEILVGLMDSLDYKDFFEGVYSDIDQVLTLRIWF